MAPMAIKAVEGSTLGAIVTGCRVADLDEGAFKAIESAWHEHAVIVFPGQHLNDEQQSVFSRRFGAFERLLTDKAPDARIGLLSNQRPDGSLIPPEGPFGLLLLGNTFWHADSSFKRVPAKASLLSARTVPTQGGDTEWADMRAAYDALDEPTRTRLDGKRAVHSYEYSQGLIGGLDVLTKKEWEALPPVEHPIVLVHPVTRRRSLFIGRHASHIVGEDIEDSRAFLKRLTHDAARAPHTFRHTWSEGDLVIWDNRCVLHRGHSWPTDQVRTMARTTIAGEDSSNEWLL